MCNDSVVPSPCSGSSGITILKGMKCRLGRRVEGSGEVEVLTCVNLMARAGQVHRECGDPMHQPPSDELFLVEKGQSVNTSWREFK